MPFVHGSRVDEQEEMNEQDSDDLVAVLLFLAKQGLVYTDFRPANVLRSEADQRIRLIDYDDIKLVGASAVKDEYDIILGKGLGSHAFGRWVAEAISATTRAKALFKTQD